MAQTTQNSQSYGPAAIIIVNWNGWRDTVACLRSCEELDYPDFTIYVVDNGSTNDSVAQIRAAFPHVRIIETGSNLGFAGGNNVGITAALDEGARFVWLLNNDTVIEPAALSALVEACATLENVGVAGSKITYYDDHDMLWYAGGEFTPEGPVKHRGFNEPDTGQYELSEPTGFVTGCSLLTTAEVIERVGLLAEEYFLYWEEVDFDWRVLQAGYELRYVPQSIVRHKVAGSLGESWSIRQTEYLVRNMLLFYLRNEPDRVNEVYRKARRDAIEHFRNRRFALAWATLRGMWLFLRRKFGPISA